MKYEVFVARYASVIVEAEDEGSAQMKVADMTDEEIEKNFDSESTWCIEYAEEQVEEEC